MLRDSATIRVHTLAMTSMGLITQTLHALASPPLDPFPIKILVKYHFQALPTLWEIEVRGRSSDDFFLFSDCGPDDN